MHGLVVTNSIPLREHNRRTDYQVVSPSRLPRKSYSLFVLRVSSLPPRSKRLSHFPFRTSFTARIPSYTESEIPLAERYILKIIDWNLSFPNPMLAMHFLRRISKAHDYDLK